MSMSMSMSYISSMSLVAGSPTTCRCQDDEGRDWGAGSRHFCQRQFNNLGAKRRVSQVGARILRETTSDSPIWRWPASLVFQVSVWQQKSDYIWYGPCQSAGARHAAVKHHKESSFSQFRQLIKDILWFSSSPCKRVTLSHLWCRLSHSNLQSRKCG